MARSYLAEDVIQLPPLSAGDALALATALVARMERGPLPPFLERSAAKVVTCLGNLREAMRQRAEAEADSGEVRIVDRDLDAAWGALLDLCRSYVDLPYEDNLVYAKAARTLVDALFYDGLKFTQLKVRDQWVESQTRLDLIESRGLQPLIEQLGGTVHLQTLRRAHDAYGRVLRITDQSGESARQVASERKALSDAIRAYVLRVAAYGEDDDEQALVTSESLIAPLIEWRTRRASPAGADEAGDVETDEAGTNPDSGESGESDADTGGVTES